MFSPSNHLINFTHAHLHVIHMDINGIKKNEAVVYEFCSHMHAMVMVGCPKSLGSFGGTGKENVFQTCPRQTRMVRHVHGACGGMHAMTPTFGSMWAWPMWPPRQGVHELGHKTHVASHRGPVLGFYRWKTPKKCIECRK